jgi:hypothetical protein
MKAVPMRAAPISADDRLDEMIAARSVANREFFTAEADTLARLCHRMAERFARGGRLVAVGVSPGASATSPSSSSTR